MTSLQATHLTSRCEFTWYGTQKQLRIDIKSNGEISVTIVAQNIFQRLYNTMRGKEVCLTIEEHRAIRKISEPTIPIDLIGGKEFINKGKELTTEKIFTRILDQVRDLQTAKKLVYAVIFPFETLLAPLNPSDLSNLLEEFTVGIQSGNNLKINLVN